MPSILPENSTSSLSPPPIPSNQDPPPEAHCPGFFYDVILIVPSVLFVLFLAFQAKKNLRKLSNGRSYVMISYYALVWVVSLLNLAWCSLQAWQCSPGGETSWNLLSVFTASGLLFLELSLVAFLLQENYISGLEALSRTFLVSGIAVIVDIILKAIYIFGFGVPMYADVGSAHRVKWALWTIYQIVLTAVYAFILFVHFAKQREELPPRPAFYKYVVVMFGVNSVALLASMLAGLGSGFGLWLFSISIICYHTLYLPFLYVTFLADFFKEDDFLLDNVYYSEMKDAGFFDADWD